MKSCVISPSKGKTLHSTLKKALGYDKATELFLRVISPRFISDYKDTLILDEEGVPTYDSLMANSYVQKFLGKEGTAKVLSNDYKPVEDTRDNYRIQLDSAYAFNTYNNSRDKYVAIVEPVDDNKIKVNIVPKTTESFSRFKHQYASYQLNKKLASIFSNVGVTVDNLSDAEVQAGRIGVTDFSKTLGIANGFANMIRVANNMEGEVALSEEFTHLLIGLQRNNPLITRAINSLVNNEQYLKDILGEDYNDVVEFSQGDMELVAEEALGHIIENNLIKETINTPAPSLFRRLINYLKSLFVGYNVNDVRDAVFEAENFMSTYVQNIAKSVNTIKKEDVRKAYRETQLNALSDRIDRNIKILLNAADVEIKRSKLSKNEDVAEARKAQVINIKSKASKNADTVLGIFEYAKAALEVLRDINVRFSITSDSSLKDTMAFLRAARSYVKSYAPFIRELRDAVIEESTEEDNMFVRDFVLDGETTDIKGILKELSDVSDDIMSKYLKVGMPAFTEFLRPFFGREITIPIGDRKGEKITIESLLNDASQDISFIDLWLDSMANSSDIRLQLFDAAVKDANDKARFACIEEFANILIFREWAEKNGITDHEFMFEHLDDGTKSGNYISEINHGQFRRDELAFEEELDKKYGKNPIGEKAKAKIKERDNWYSIHAITDDDGTVQPHPDYYKNKDFYNLTDTQKEFRNRFLDFKSFYDKKYPPSRVDTLKAIQIRKTMRQRMWQSITSPSTLWDNVKEEVKNTFLDAEDDDTIYGSTSNGITDFEGNQFNMLPVLYTRRLKDPNELSTDLFGSLMQYAYAANKFEQIDEILDTLEVGKTLVLENSKIQETRGDKPLQEKFSALGQTVTNKLLKRTESSNFAAKLKEFFESQVYQKYVKDEGSISVFGTDISVTKLGNFALKAGSLAQLGFNWLANLANVTTGLCMSNIEAAAGQYVKVSSLAKADKIFFSYLHEQIAECGKRTKTNKVDLFLQLIDYKGDYSNSLRNQAKKLLERVFGAELAYLGQDAGDRWLYARVAIAMALETQVMFNGKVTNLWDALDVITVEGSDNVKMLNYKSIAPIEGSDFTVARFSRKAQKVNQILFGIYNDEDANVANRIVLGRALQQYRKWMVPAYEHRFQKLQWDNTLKVWREGYHRTFVRFVYGLAKGGFHWNAEMQKLPPELRANVNRAITEMVQFMAVLAIAKYARWGDDKSKKRSWGLKLAEYSCKRLVHELGTLAPSPYMVREVLKTVKTPLPVLTVIQNATNLGLSLIDPTDWNDEIQSGPYKGMSTLHKNFIKAPLPGIAQYRQINKFIEDIDNSISYYARPN